MWISRFTRQFSAHCQRGPWGCHLRGSVVDSSTPLSSAGEAECRGRTSPVSFGLPFSPTGPCLVARGKTQQDSVGEGTNFV